MATIYANPYCDFCSALRFNMMLLENRRDKLNAKAHVKTIRAYQGVIINNYLTDDGKRIYEKYTKTFPRINYCPQCGQLLRNRRQFGKKRDEKWDE